MRVSCIVPARQSAHCLEDTVHSLVDFFENRWHHNFEILVVLNRNPWDPEDFSEIISKTILAKYDSVRFLHSKPGKGQALKTGFEASQGEWIFFTDSDLPYDLHFFEMAAKRLELGFHFVSGNRRSYESFFKCPVTLLPFVYKRHRLGMAFNAVVRFLFGIQSTDTQCGIKAMTRTLASEVFQRQTCHGFLFDLEVFLVKSGLKFPSVQIPVTFELRNEKSTIQLFRELFSTSFWLMRLFLQKQLGFYDRKGKLSELATLILKIAKAPLGLKERSFLLLRIFLTPYRQMISHLPETGKILDLGCGHGLLPILAALGNRKREILGIDHDSKRISAAKKLGSGVSGLTFVDQMLEDHLENSDKYEAICILDTLHYFPWERQSAILQKAFDALPMVGTLLVREIDSGPGLISVWNKGYENWAVKSKVTKAQGLYFRNKKDWLSLFHRCGFEVRTESCSSWMFSDVLFICTKPGANLALNFQQNALVTADDWGMSPSVNEAILSLARKGMVRRVSLMAKSPFVRHGLEELLSLSDVELGLHFDVTSQFTGGFRGPLSFLCRWFNPFVSKSEKSAWIEEEAKRQFSLLHQLGVTPSHFDSHHHIHLVPGVLRALREVLKSERIRKVRLPYHFRLWFSTRIPINLLSIFARRSLILSGFDFLPCYYPFLRDFRSPEKLSRILEKYRGYEVIVHPSSEDDFEQHGIRDTYGRERILEYQGLTRALMHENL